MIRNPDPQDSVDKQGHKEYRSEVGMLLWLVKHSRQDIASSVYELTKVLDSTSNVSYKEMLQAIKFVLDTKHFGLCMWPFLGNIYLGSYYASWNLTTLEILIVEEASLVTSFSSEVYRWH